MTLTASFAPLTGSPAHAGIDRRERAGRFARWGFPRTRGDRRELDAFADGYRGVPPHTRG